MVFPIDYNKDINGDNKDESTVETNNKKQEEQEEQEGQEEQCKTQKGKQSLASLPDRKKLNQFPDKNKGKKLLTPDSSYPPFNHTKESAQRIVPVQTPAQTPTIVGPYGSQVGSLWDDGTHNTVRQIVVVAGNCVESIHIEYVDDGESVWSQKHGGLGKFYEDKIMLDYPEEFLISVSGYYKTNRNGIRVMSLTFHGNRRVYGPFGVESGVYFTFPSTGGKIIGFHGRCTESLLCSIGAHYEPCLTRGDNNERKLNKAGDEVGVGSSADAPISMGPFGGQGGSSWNDGFFTTVRQLVIVLDSGIKSIHIEYDKNGSSEWSEEHGESGPHVINKVKLEYPNEFLISISGFYSSESIQGLTIQSNRKTYGPFGKDGGTHFSTPSTGGKIIGFYGHCDTNLVSIGAYFEPIFYPRPAFKTPMSVGPFGGRSGVSFDDGTFTGVRQITIASGLVVDSISIEYDNNGCSVNSMVRGGRGGVKSMITLDYPDEFLISAWGYISTFRTFVIVRSLTLQSNRKTYGPFGTERGKKFSFPSTGGKIIGFHGKSGLYLDAIGAYLEPTTHSLSSLKTPLFLENASEKALSSNELDEGLSTASTSHDELPERLSRLTMYGPWGGTAGKTFDDGVFTGIRAIHLTYKEALNSIKVLYDRGGQPMWGSKNGGSFGLGFGLRLEKIEFNYPSEILTHISGSYQSTTFTGEMAISSITFHTTKQTYGPFGTREGNFFSSKVGDGPVVGFHGRKGKYVYGIGVHLVK